MASPHHIVRCLRKLLRLVIAAVAIAVSASAQQIAFFPGDTSRPVTPPARIEPLLFELDRLIEDIRTQRILDSDTAHVSVFSIRLQREWILSRLELIRAVYLNSPLTLAPSNDVHTLADSIGGLPITALTNSTVPLMKSPYGVVLDPQRVRFALDSLQRIIGEMPRLQRNYDSLRVTLKTAMDSLTLLKDFYRMISGGPFHFGLGFIGNWYVSDIRKYYIDRRDSTVYVDHGTPFSGFISVVMNLEVAETYRLGISVPLTELRLSERSSLSGLFNAQIPFGLSLGRVIRSVPPVIAAGVMVHVLPMDELVGGGVDLAGGIGASDAAYLGDLDLKKYPVRTVTKVGIGMGLFIEL